MRLAQSMCPGRPIGRAAGEGLLYPRPNWTMAALAGTGPTGPSPRLGGAYFTCAVYVHMWCWLPSPASMSEATSAGLTSQAKPCWGGSSPYQHGPLHIGMAERLCMLVQAAC